MENSADIMSPEETDPLAAGLFNGMMTSASPQARPSGNGFLGEIERMPHFDVPSRESFVRNFLMGRKGLFVIES